MHLYHTRRAGQFSLTKGESYLDNTTFLWFGYNRLFLFFKKNSNISGVTGYLLYVDYASFIFTYIPVIFEMP
jgi:hypothetical protein